METITALTATCKRCGKPLSVHKSVERGIGPICIHKDNGVEQSNDQMKIFGDSFIFDFKGYGNCKSQCQVDLIRENEKIIVVLTDIGVGTSVTNFSEEIATQLVYVLGLDPLNTLWAEQYRPGKKDHTLDQVLYRWDGKKYRKPEWIRIKALTQIALPPHE